MITTLLVPIMGFIFGVLISLFLILVINLLTFQRLPLSERHSRRIGDEEQGQPLVSLLVPARNEAACIAACVRSLVAQKYAHMEVIVLDDGSTDATASIVRQIIAELPAARKGRLRLVEGKPLPTGWVGKNFACMQLAQQARGDYLLFTDADTVHAPEMLPSVISAMQHYRVDLLTAQPEYLLGSPGEHLIIPLLNFTILTLLPIMLVSARPEASLSTGNGQLLCFKRGAYEAINGHAAVKNRILEDVLLARAVKAAGYRMIFVDAFELVQCRMYHSFAEVWNGFSKNLFAFYNYSPVFASLALLLNLGLFVLPPLALLLAIVLPLSPMGLLFAAGGYLIAILMRVLLMVRFTRSQRSLMLLFCLLHPVSIVLECLILLNSMRWRYRRRGTTWKGRQYV